MNANALRHFYDYHFSQNRTMWETYISQLSDEQFTQAVEYSQGSVHNQIIHLIQVDEAWFSDLSSQLPDDESDPQSREAIRAYWDKVEQKMRDYLATVSDEMLWQKPLTGEDENLLLWQILLHVVNHGTDHRAQIHRLLHDLGVKTVSQDYIFYVYDNPLSG